MKIYYVWRHHVIIYIAAAKRERNYFSSIGWAVLVFNQAENRLHTHKAFYFLLSEGRMMKSFWLIRVV